MYQFLYNDNKEAIIIKAKKMFNATFKLSQNVIKKGPKELTKKIYSLKSLSDTFAQFQTEEGKEEHKVFF